MTQEIKIEVSVTQVLTKEEKEELAKQIAKALKGGVRSNYFLGGKVIIEQEKPELF